MDEPMHPDPTSLEPTKDERTMAMLAHLLGIFGGFIGPLILYAVKGPESKFIAYHAMQALIFQLAYLAIVFIIVLPISFCTFGLGTFLVFPLLIGVVGGTIWMAMKANDGKWEGYPLIDQYGLPK